MKLRCKISSPNSSSKRWRSLIKQLSWKCCTKVVPCGYNDRLTPAMIIFYRLDMTLVASWLSPWPLLISALFGVVPSKMWRWFEDCYFQLSGLEIQLHSMSYLCIMLENYGIKSIVKYNHDLLVYTVHNGCLKCMTLCVLSTHMCESVQWWCQSSCNGQVTVTLWNRFIYMQFTYVVCSTWQYRPELQQVALFKTDIGYLQVCRGISCSKDNYKSLFWGTSLPFSLILISLTLISLIFK